MDNGPEKFWLLPYCPDSTPLIRVSLLDRPNYNPKPTVKFSYKKLEDLPRDRRHLRHNHRLRVNDADVLNDTSSIDSVAVPSFIIHDIAKLAGPCIFIVT
jgi:hypothetical protein